MRAIGLLTGIALVGLSGCYKTSIIPATGLGRLANCGAGDCILIDSDGDDTRLDEKTDVTIVRDGQRLPAHRFISIHIESNAFVGMTASGERVEVPLASIQQLELRRFSGGRTVALALIPFEIATIILAVYVFVAYSGLPSK